jgi:hypothetical protein
LPSTVGDPQHKFTPRFLLYIPKPDAKGNISDYHGVEDVSIGRMGHILLCLFKKKKSNH